MRAWVTLIATLWVVRLSASPSEVGEPSQIQALYVMRPLKYVYRTYEEDGKTLKDKTKKIPEQLSNDRVAILLNVHSHTGNIDALKLFSSRLKYEILVSKDEDYIPDFRTRVFFGGNDQYAFYVNDEEPIIGKIGEVVIYQNFSVYAGARDDPSVFDLSGFTDLSTRLCEPTRGFRCADASDPANTFAKKNVGSIIIDLPISMLTGESDPNLGKIKVWAKVYKQR